MFWIWDNFLKSRVFLRQTNFADDWLPSSQPGNRYRLSTFYFCLKQKMSLLKIDSPRQNQISPARRTTGAARQMDMLRRNFAWFPKRHWFWRVETIFLPRWFHSTTNTMNIEGNMKWENKIKWRLLFSKIFINLNNYITWLSKCLAIRFILFRYLFLRGLRGTQIGSASSSSE